MRARFIWLLAPAAAVAVVVAAVSGLVAGQVPAATGRGYTPPRTPDGRPDLQGVWKVWNLAKYDIEDHSAKPGVPAGKGFVVDPPDGKIPYQPWALERRKQNHENTKTTDPVKNADPLAKCYIPGIPRMTYLGWPFQIIQTSQYVAFNYEWSHHQRFVYTDRTDHLEGVDFWWGISRGRYEGNALVVNVTNFNAVTWFDMAGNFHSDALKIVERYTPVNADALQYDVNFEDPKVFTRPWKISMPILRQKDVGILDYECTAMLDEMGIDHTWERDWDEQPPFPK